MIISEQVPTAGAQPAAAVPWAAPVVLWRPACEQHGTHDSSTGQDTNPNGGMGAEKAGHKRAQAGRRTFSLCGCLEGQVQHLVFLRQLRGRWAAMGGKHWQHTRVNGWVEEG